METTFVDDRTEEERKTHRIAYGGTDCFLSGWGHAEGGNSFAFWACRPEDRCEVKKWVRSRGDIMRLRQILPNEYRPGGNCVHCHIYAVRSGHAALGGAQSCK